MRGALSAVILHGDAGGGGGRGNGGAEGFISPAVTEAAGWRSVIAFTLAFTLRGCYECKRSRNERPRNESSRFPLSPVIENI